MTSVEDQTRGVIDEFIQRLMEEARKMERGEVPILTGPMALRKFATDLLMAKEEWEEERRRGGVGLCSYRRCNIRSEGRA